MIKEIIQNPIYLIFLLIVLAVVIFFIVALVNPSMDIGQWIFGTFRTLFHK